MATSRRYIYVASSWRNVYQQSVVFGLRLKGHIVYDYRNPEPGNHGFHWSEIDPNYAEWDDPQFVRALEHPVAVAGFGYDWTAMTMADTCVLVLPCGRSAHLEAGYFVGAKKDLHILLMDRNVPELMYKMATSISLSFEELVKKLA